MTEVNPQHCTICGGVGWFLSNPNMTMHQKEPCRQCLPTEWEQFFDQAPGAAQDRRLQRFVAGWHFPTIFEPCRRTNGHEE